MNNELSYYPSGQYSLPGAALGLVLGLAAAGILGPIYGAFTAWLPIAGFVTFILAVLLGGALGGVTAQGMRWGRVRNASVAMVVGGLVGLVGLYLAWGAWLWGVLDSSEHPLSFRGLLRHPGTMAEAILKINRSGAWSIAGTTPSGGALSFLWVLEAVLVVAPAAFIPVGVVSEPFCERCHAWCVKQKEVATRRTARDDEVARLKQKDLDLLGAMGPSAPGAPAFMRLDLASCSKCRQMHTLSAANVHVTVDNKGKRSAKESPVVTDLLVSEHEAEAIRKLAAPEGNLAT
jgi:hypothetical protein